MNTCMMLVIFHPNCVVRFCRSPINAAKMVKFNVMYIIKTTFVFLADLFTF